METGKNSCLVSFGYIVDILLQPASAAVCETITFKTSIPLSGEIHFTAKFQVVRFKVKNYVNKLK